MYGHFPFAGLDRTWVISGYCLIHAFVYLFSFDNFVFLTDTVTVNRADVILTDKFYFKNNSRINFNLKTIRILDLHLGTYWSTEPQNPTWACEISLSMRRNANKIDGEAIAKFGTC